LLPPRGERAFLFTGDDSMAPRGFVDIEGWIIRETDAAILLEVDEAKYQTGGEFWLPKAEIQTTDLGYGMVKVLVPEWLAVKKDMI